MENKKTKLGITICVITIILLVVALAAVLVYYNYEDKIVENVSTEEIETVKTIKKLDPSKDLIYSIKNSFEAGQDKNIQVIRPVINIDSEYVNEVNEEIKAIYTPTEENLEFVGLNESTVWEEKTEKYLNDNILSVVVDYSSREYVFNPLYKAYNIDVYTGEKITTADILALKGIDEETFVSNLKEAYKAKYIEEYGNESDDFSLEQMNNTISDENCNASVDIYLNIEGKICAIANIYSTAGADSYNYLVVTDM